MRNDDGTMNSYQYLKMQHKCTACGTRDAYTMAGHALCADCNEKNNSRSKENYKKNSSRKLETQKDRRERLRADGICIQCGSRPVDNAGHSRCAVCRALNARRRRQLSARASRDTANQCGLCLKCLKPLADGEEKMCRTCREKVFKFSKAGRESQGDKIGTEWRKCW